MKLSHFIRVNVEAILEGWEPFAKNLAATRHVNMAALRDHAAGMLNAIAADLDRPQTHGEPAKKSKRLGPQRGKEAAAGMHGAARVSASLGVIEAMSEFRALRETDQRLWTDSNPTVTQAVIDELIQFNEAIAWSETRTRRCMWQKTQDVTASVSILLGCETRLGRASK